MCIGQLTYGSPRATISGLLVHMHFQTSTIEEAAATALKSAAMVRVSGSLDPDEPERFSKLGCPHTLHVMNVSSLICDTTLHLHSAQLHLPALEHERRAQACSPVVGHLRRLPDSSLTEQAGRTTTQT